LRDGDLSDIEAVILAGGLGTRLRSALPDVPKILAPLGGRPLLESIVGGLARSGVRRVVLSLGHLSDRVIEYVERRCAADDVEFVPIVEKEPAGTAGGLRLAAAATSSDPILVVNGDTILDADFSVSLARFRAKGVLLSILCAPAKAAGRFGAVEADSSGMIVRFAEKPVRDRGAALVSVGAYFFSRAAIRLLEVGPHRSLEEEFFPSLCPGRIFADVIDGQFDDLGTPESYRQALTKFG
jgi:NDP-sugar pyrophosphorylase family protein